MSKKLEKSIGKAIIAAAKSLQKKQSKLQTLNAKLNKQAEAVGLKARDRRTQRGLDKFKADIKQRKKELAAIDRVNKSALYADIEGRAKRYSDIDKVKAKIKEKRSYERRLKSYYDRLREYNKGVYDDSQSRSLYFKPNDEKELEKANKILRALKANKDETAKKLLEGLSKTKSTTPNANKTIRRLSSEANGNDGYARYSYYQKAIETSSQSSMPELANLFRLLGEESVNYLGKLGFTITLWIDSDGQGENLGRSELIELVEMFSGALRPRDQQIIADWLKKNA